MSDPTPVSLAPWVQQLFDTSIATPTLKDMRYFAIFGGRGSSKSRAMATILILEAASKPCRILCCREVQRSIRDSVKRLLDDEIDRLGWRHAFHSTDAEIKNKLNGSLFIFAGLQHNIDSIKSMEGITHCWVEEAQTMSQGSIETLDPTIRTPGSKMFFTWNPKSPKDPVDVMFRGEENGPPPRSLVLQVNYQDNPWFPDVLREQMEYDKRTDFGKYQHVWEGAYLVRSNANVFQNWRIEEFEAPEDAFFRFGCDWGFSVDPTVLIRNYNIGRKIYIDYEAYQIGCEIDDTPALFATVPEADKWPIIADSASPERVAYMRKHGYPKMMGAKKGRKSIEEGIGFLQSQEIIVHPRCEKTIFELMNYKYRIDPQTNEITNVLEDKNNHLCVAGGTLVYMGDSVCKPIENIEVGEEVWTRGGRQTVLASAQTGVDVECLLIVCEDGLPLFITPEHKILTDRGWLKAEDVRVADLVLQIGLPSTPASGYVPKWTCLTSEGQKIKLGNLYGPHSVGTVAYVGRGGKHNVYNLEVENIPEFYAGFTLVHNCDALRYSQEAVRRFVKSTENKKLENFVPLPSQNHWNR